MAVYDIDITRPANGAVVSPKFTVDVKVGRDDNETITVLVAVEKDPPIDMDESWDESSKKGYWLVCKPSNQFQFYCDVACEAGAYFVRARASITQSGNTWSDWTADDQRITITVRVTS